MPHYSTLISIQFKNGTPITTVDLSAFSGSQGLRDCTRIRVISATIKVTGTTPIPSVVYLTSSHSTIFPQVISANGPSFRGIPILLHPEYVDGAGNTYCKGEVIHPICPTDSKVLPQTLKFALSLDPTSAVAGSIPVIPWPTQKLLDVAGDSTVMIEVEITPGSGGFGTSILPQGGNAERFDVVVLVPICNNKKKSNQPTQPQPKKWIHFLLQDLTVKL